MKRILLGLVVVGALLTGVPAPADAWTSSPTLDAVRQVDQSVAGPDWRISGTDCNLISTKTATPVGLGIGGCPGVRPGAFVSSAIGGCTFNFLFTALGRNETFAGTAGHCIVPETKPGEYTTFANPRAMATVNGRSTHIGDFAYARLDNNFDFALIKLNAAGEAAGNAQMCHFGGPTGLRRGDGAFGDTLQHYGNGLLIGEVLPARSHIGLFSDTHSLTTASFAAIGDSGSGLTDTSGLAAGVLVAVVNVAYGSPIVISSRLDTHLDRAGVVLQRNFAVMTAPLT